MILKEKLFPMMLLAVMVMGFSQALISCKDDDEDEKKESKTQEQKDEEAYQARDAFWSVVSQLIDPDDITDDYLDKTFQPTIGEVSETNPTVRIVSVNDVAAAARRYANLVGAQVDENTQEYEYSNQAVGTLKYTRTNNGQSLATVDVNIKQLPSLQQIVFMSPEQSGENGLFGFTGDTYYRFGDVISRPNSSGVTEYWVCIRPAFSKEGKSNSYWATLSPLPKEKVFTYEYGGKTWKMPTALGNDLTSIENFGEMLFAIMNPKEWYTNVTTNDKLPLFDDFKRKYLDYHNQWFWKRVYFAWDRMGNDGKTMFQRLFNMEDVELWKQISKNGGLHLLYHGYSWWTKLSWNCNFYELTFKPGINLSANFHRPVKSEPKARMEDVDFDITRDYTWDNMPLSNEAFFGNNELRWIVRTAKGKELATNGKENVKAALQGWTDVYRYNDFYYKKQTAADMTKDPEIINSKKARSNVGRILDASGYLFDTYEQCMSTANGKGMKVPVALVVYDKNDLSVADKAEDIFNIGARFNDQSLLCISLVHSPRQLCWGDHKSLCNGEKHRFDQDKAGQYSLMIRDFGSSSITEKLASEGDEINPLHPAAYAAHNYFTEVFPDEMRWADNFTAHTEWFLPTAGHWTLFLKGLGAWNSSYDGKTLKAVIDKVYSEAGLGKQVQINGYDYLPTEVNPFGHTVWTSTEASADMAYSFSMNQSTGAYFLKAPKSDPLQIYPFIIVKGYNPY